MIYTLVGVGMAIFGARFLVRCREGFRNMEEYWHD